MEYLYILQENITGCNIHFLLAFHNFSLQLYHNNAEVSNEKFRFLAGTNNISCITECINISDSQNEEGEEDLWRSFAQTSSLKTLLPKPISRWLLHITKDEDSKTSLSNLCLRSVNVTVKKYFLMITWNLLCVSLCLLSCQ